MDSQDNNVKQGTAFGIVSFVLGLIGVFILSTILCPLSIIFGVVAIVKKNYIWSGFGIVFSIIGLLTSPVFNAILFGSAVAVSAR